MPVRDIMYRKLATIRCGMVGWVGCVTVGGALNPGPEFILDSSPFAYHTTKQLAESYQIEACLCAVFYGFLVVIRSI